MQELKQQLEAHLTFLTQLTPARNWLNHNSLDKAAHYISTHFKNENYHVEEQKWNVGKFEYTNLIAKYKPELKKRLVVGAHYDVFSDQPGADDNASGVAGLLALATLVSQKNPQLSYGIDFVSYCLEEPPHFGTKNMGSYIHAKSLSDAKTPVIGMICLDMIGYFDDRPNSQKYPNAEFTKNLPTTGNFIAVVGLTRFSEFAATVHQGMTKQNKIPVQKINFPTLDGLAGLSDHRNYWHFDFPAVMINDTAKYRNPNYHEPTDTIETLDLEKMSHVVESISEVLLHPLSVQDTSNSPSIDSPKKPSVFKRIKTWIQSKFCN